MCVSVYSVLCICDFTSARVASGTILDTYLCIAKICRAGTDTLTDTQRPKTGHRTAILPRGGRGGPLLRPYASYSLPPGPLGMLARCAHILRISLQIWSSSPRLGREHLSACGRRPRLRFRVCISPL